MSVVYVKVNDGVVGVAGLAANEEALVGVRLHEAQCGHCGY